MWTGKNHRNAPAEHTNILCLSTKRGESEVKALIELIQEGVAEVTAIQKKKCVHEECNIGTLLRR